MKITDSFQSVPVHRILPTIRKYGSGKKTYHLELWKEYKRNNSFCRSSDDQQREYCFDVPDEESMYKLAGDLKTSLNISTDAQVIITKTYEEFSLHSKPKKISAGHYIYREHTIYDYSCQSKEWWVLKGEYGEYEEVIGQLYSKLLGMYRTLKFAMENIDILIDGSQ